jgi:hypothetical protein
MSPSGGLAPLDFMRPLDEAAPEESINEPSTSATGEQPPVTKPRLKPTRPTHSQKPGSELPMPPSRQTEVRVQLNAKLPPELVDRLRDFALSHRVDIQDVVSYSIDEFLKRRDA